MDRRNFMYAQFQEREENRGPIGRAQILKENEKLFRINPISGEVENVETSLPVPGEGTVHASWRNLINAPVAYQLQQTRGVKFYSDHLNNIQSQYKGKFNFKVQPELKTADACSDSESDLPNWPTGSPDAFAKCCSIKDDENNEIDANQQKTKSKDNKNNETEKQLRTKSKDNKNVDVAVKQFKYDPKEMLDIDELPEWSVLSNVASPSTVPEKSKSSRNKKKGKTSKLISPEEKLASSNVAILNSPVPCRESPVCPTLSPMTACSSSTYEKEEMPDIDVESELPEWSVLSNVASPSTVPEKSKSTRNKKKRKTSKVISPEEKLASLNVAKLNSHVPCKESPMTTWTSSTYEKEEMPDIDVESELPEWSVLSNVASPSTVPEKSKSSRNKKRGKTSKLISPEEKLASSNVAKLNSPVPRKESPVCPTLSPTTAWASSTYEKEKKTKSTTKCEGGDKVNKEQPSKKVWAPFHYRETDKPSDKKPSPWASVSSEKPTTAPLKAPKKTKLLKDTKEAKKIEIQKSPDEFWTPIDIREVNNFRYSDDDFPSLS